MWQLREWIQYLRPFAFHLEIKLKPREGGNYIVLGLADLPERSAKIVAEVFSEDGKYLDEFYVDHYDMDWPPLEGICGLDMYSEGWYVENWPIVDAFFLDFYETFEKIKRKRDAEAERFDS